METDKAADAAKLVAINLITTMKGKRPNDYVNVHG